MWHIRRKPLCVKPGPLALQQDFASQKLEMNLQDSVSRALENVNH